MNPKVKKAVKTAIRIKRQNPRSAKAFRVLQKHLRASAFKNYLNVMRELLSHHQNYDFCRTLSGLFRGKRYDKVLATADSMSAQLYTDATELFLANQFSLLIRKYPWPKDLVNTDPEAVAIEKFRLSERKCSLINRRFRYLGNTGTSYEPLLSRLRSIIRYVIGDEPNMESVVSLSGFSAGASMGVHGNSTHVAKKLSRSKWTCTPCAMTYAYWCLMSEPHTRELLCEWNGTDYYSTDIDLAKANFYQRLTTVTNNKLSFVPKTAKTHRVIAVEPLLNGLIQKGIDLELRKKLLRVGIDLSDQSVNQELARQGSLDDSDLSHVTIDLESASDSVSIQMVKNLIPPAWFDLLNCVRSPEYELDGTIKRYQKFCSMGNGFCFPLETLIFYACVVASNPRGIPGTDFSVYGDDIVVRKCYSSDTLRNLKLLGFKRNDRKTFLQGPFRESCGTDWFGGVDVRPYTLDNALDSLQELFKWLNLTRRNSRTENFFAPVRDLILSFIPVDFQFHRPQEGPEDTGINSVGLEFMSCPSVSWKRKRFCWAWHELRHKAISDDKPYDDASRRFSVDLYAILSGSRPKDDSSVEYTLRRKTRTTVRKTHGAGATSQWLPSHTLTVGVWRRAI